MAVEIRNISSHDGLTEPSEYTVRINDGPVLARFTHMRPEGLAECLRRAAAAVDAASLPPWKPPSGAE